jgi:hypothetical protein
MAYEMLSLYKKVPGGELGSWKYVLQQLNAPDGIRVSFVFSIYLTHCITYILSESVREGLE